MTMIPFPVLTPDGNAIAYWDEIDDGDDESGAPHFVDEGEPGGDDEEDE